jgi:hypothetical protein
LPVVNIDQVSLQVTFLQGGDGMTRSTLVGVKAGSFLARILAKLNGTAFPIVTAD